MKIHTAEFVKGLLRWEDFDMPPLPQVAFIGRSNVGKSSLINHLLNRKKLVKTSGTPGKTQMLNFFLINESFYLVDLPGYGFAAPRGVRDSWRAMIYGYLLNCPDLHLIFQLVDIRHEPSKEDRSFCQSLMDAKLPYQLVANKSDKLGNNQVAKQIKIIKKILNQKDSPLAHSSTEKTGKAELLKLLEQAVMI